MGTYFTVTFKYFWEFRVVYYSAVSSIAIAQLHELLDDTCVAVGSDAYSAALQVYGYAKANGNVSGLDELIAEMGKRFGRQSRNTNGEEQSSTGN